MADPTLDLAESTRRLIRTVDALADGGYAEPSALPDWTRAHVLAHLALNAEGLAAALAAIVEGERHPMYASQDARNADIADLAAQEPAVVRARLLGAGTELADAIAAIPPDEVGTAIERVPGGPTFTVAEVPWMRLREVEIHHVDLAAGYLHTAWSQPFAAHVLDAMVTRVRGSVPFTARPTDLEGDWTYGEGGPVVSGRAVDLAWWVTGRGAGEGLTSDRGALPQIGAW